MTDQNLIDSSLENQNIGNLDNSAATQSERMVPQSQLESIVKGRMADAYKKGREEALAEHKTQGAQQSQYVGGMKQLTPEEIRQQMLEVAREEVRNGLTHQANHIAGQQILNQFIQKVEAGKSKYPDFESKVAQLQLDKIPEIIPLVTHMDNTADILMDLTDNPHKVGMLLQNLRDPRTMHLAHQAVQQLSNSIKTNQAAQQQPVAAEPLSQLNHSTLGGDSGRLSIRDFKNNPKYRG